MKTVLVLTRKLQPQIGGMQTQIRTLLTALRRRSDVKLIVVGHTGGILGLPFFFCRALVAAISTDAQTVHVGDVFLSPIFFLLSVLRPRLKRTVTVHGLDLTWKAFGYQTIIRRALRLADCVVAVSTHTAGLAQARGVQMDRIVVLPCAVPSNFQTSPHRSRQLLLLSRLVKRKGTLWFLQNVLPSFHAKHPDVRVIVAGDGPEMHAIQSFLDGSSLALVVTLVGEVTEEQKQVFLLESMALIVPNIRIDGDPEGFGIVCLEAAACGLPTVSARLEGLQDAVTEGVTGTFFASGSAQDALLAIDRALQSSWDTHAMHAVLHDRFDPDVIASHYVHDVF